MTARERFQKCMNFEKPDRLPMIEWATWWDKTIDRWKSEGLEIGTYEGLSEWQAIHKTMGLDLQLQAWIGFKTDKTPASAWHGAPIVESMEDYERIRPTLFPEDPLKDHNLELYAEMQAKGAIVWITLEGPFWGPRTLLGIENHLYAFYDEPELMHRINRDLCEYNRRVFDKVLEYLTPDFMTFAEDMSYN